jgi:hypothetical protein
MSAALQSTAHLLMIDPVAFGCNPQTLESNHYQHTPEHTAQSEISWQARLEARAFRDVLVEAGVIVTTFQGLPTCPDDVFPNNWVSTEADSFTLYPMLAENRQRERRADIIAWLEKRYKLQANYAQEEHQGRILEGTGSLVLDRVNRTAYACLSPRTDDTLFHTWCDEHGYAPIAFPATDTQGHAIYHTNVMMFIATGIAGICLEAIPESHRQQVYDSLSRHHEIVVLSPAQINSFCGNALEVRNTQGERFMAMSRQAEAGLTAEQKARLLQHTVGILSSPLNTIEHYGGGSARCMLLQLF